MSWDAPDGLTKIGSQKTMKPLLSALLIAVLTPLPLDLNAADISEGKITDSGPRHAVTATYPIFQDPAMGPANEAIRTFVRSFVTPFLEEQAGDEQESADGFEMPAWSLEIGYQAPYRTDRYVAIDFDGYDFRGGAHGMPIIAPLVLALPEGRRIPAEALFRPDSDWLEFLSEYCYGELRGREFVSGDDDWLATGTAPKPENFSLIYPGPKGLTVTFPPYAVAPYAAGPQEVSIPYSRLTDRLAPNLFSRR